MSELGKKCESNQNLKNTALRHFAKSKNAEGRQRISQLKNAKQIMLNYSEFCPGDPEAQIYLNNYNAQICLNELGHNSMDIPAITLAAVVPISRTMGVKDSIEVLRGISYAQHESNIIAANHSACPHVKGNMGSKQSAYPYVSNANAERPNSYPFIFIKIFDDGLPSESEEATR